MEEAVSGVKGQLAIKIYGDDLKTLEAKGDEIVNVMRTVPGISDLGLFRVIGQPNLEFEVDRDKAARYGINVADVQDAIETAVGGKAVSQVLQGEQRYDLVVRYQPPYRNTKEAIENIRLLAPIRRARFAGATLPRERARRRVRNLSRRQLALRRHEVQRAWARPGQHRGRSHAPKSTQQRQTAHRLSHRLGRRIRKRRSARQSG